MARQLSPLQSPPGAVLCQAFRQEQWPPILSVTTSPFAYAPNHHQMLTHYTGPSLATGDIALLEEVAHILLDIFCCSSPLAYFYPHYSSSLDMPGVQAHPSSLLLFVMS